MPVLRAGWGLVWRRQRLLWWIYFVSLGMAFLATLPFVLMIGTVLDNSLASDRLYHAFDLGFLAELLSRQDVDAPSAALASVLAGIVFAVLMVLFTGGVLRAYNEDRTFTTGEFFAACGQYFWRFVRLIVLLMLVLIPVGLINAGFRAWSGSLADRIASPAPSLSVNIAGRLIVLFLLMAVRLWFDLAEVQVVAEDEYAVRRTWARSFRLTWRNMRSLYWIYLVPSFVVWAGTALGLWILVEFVPHSAVGLILLVTQAIVFLWVFTRLWQRAAETLWYQHKAPAPIVVPFAEPAGPGLDATLIEPAPPQAPIDALASDGREIPGRDLEL